MNINNVTGWNEIKLNWLDGQFWNDLRNHLIAFVLRKHIPDIDIISINHNCYDYWNNDTIEYLYNDNKIKYCDFSLLINKWQKNGLETSKRKAKRGLMVIDSNWI